MVGGWAVEVDEFAHCCGCVERLVEMRVLRARTRAEMWL